MGAGFERLCIAVEKDCEEHKGTFHPDGCCKCNNKCFHDYCDKFKWAIDRAKAYGKATGLNWQDILDVWEEDRSYWYMNYYQDCNQPVIENGVKPFETIEDLKKSLRNKRKLKSRFWMQNREN